MSLIFNELEYAMSLLENGFSSFMKWEDLFILAKYFRSLGMNDYQVLDNLESFCIKYNPQFNKIIYGDKLDSVIKKSEKQELRISSGVFITEKEIDFLREIKNYKIEKILFIMLIIAKNSKIVNKSDNENYYINLKFSTIVSMAKVYINKEERNDIKHYLFINEFIKNIPPNYYNTRNNLENFGLNFIFDNSGSKIFVPPNSMSCAISFYKPICQNCGKEIKRYSEKNKLCNDCWQEKRKNDIKNNVRKYRNTNVIR